jgi:uncharacterized membrane protein (GlpM family)
MKILYKAVLVSPMSVTLCSATASWNNTYTYTGWIPPTATAFANGAHEIVAKSRTSHIEVIVTFTNCVDRKVRSGRTRLRGQGSP